MSTTANTRRMHIYLSGNLLDTISTVADLLGTTETRVVKAIVKQWYLSNQDKIVHKKFGELAQSLEPLLYL